MQVPYSWLANKYYQDNVPPGCATTWCLAIFSAQTAKTINVNQYDNMRRMSTLYTSLGEIDKEDQRLSAE